MQNLKCLTIKKVKKGGLGGSLATRETVLLADVNCNMMFELNGVTHEEETYKSDIEITLTEGEQKVIDSLWERLEASYKVVN